MFSMLPPSSGEALRKGPAHDVEQSARALQEKARIKNAVITAVKNRNLITGSFPKKIIGTNCIMFASAVCAKDV
jgi:hypothetical protein